MNINVAYDAHQTFLCGRFDDRSRKRGDCAAKSPYGAEDYDINMGRYVQGVDLWPNTPRRPLEASGTSGQKVVPNGGST